MSINYKIHGLYNKKVNSTESIRKRGIYHEVVEF